jgi:hypothetical protein
MKTSLVSKLSVALSLAALAVGGNTKAALLLDEDFSSYPSGTLLEDAGWTMSDSPWGGMGHILITRNTGFGPEVSAIEGATGYGRNGYIAAHRGFASGAVGAMDTVVLTADLYLRVGQNMSRIGLYTSDVPNNGDPLGIHVEATGGSGGGRT